MQRKKLSYLLGMFITMLKMLMYLNPLILILGYQTENTMNNTVNALWQALFFIVKKINKLYGQYKANG